MSVLDDLERQLARSVDAGAAAPDPARAAVDGAGSRDRRRWWGRRGGRLLALVLVAGGVTTGALAATGVLHVVPEQEGAYLPMVGDEGAGVPSSPVRVLPLRVRDPLGGPPWVIRTFTTNRQAACAQAGQLYRGHFGRVERDRRNRPVFRRIGIHIGETARCTNAVQTGGLPVLRGLRAVNVLGGAGSPGRCADAAGRAADCPIDAVTVVRWGLVGPRAQRAWSVRDGRRSAPLAIPAGSGGAYLFVERVDPTPWREDLEMRQRINRKVEARFPPMRGYDSATPAERRAADANLDDKLRYLTRLHRAEWKKQGGKASPWLEQRERIDVQFDGRGIMGVAGNGADRGRLPGVQPVRDTLPARLPAAVSVDYAGRRRAIHVRFDAPVALDRFARAYRVQVEGPRSPACDRVLNAGEGWENRAPRKGMPLRLTVKPIGPNSGPQRRGWCPGATYTVRVLHHSGTLPGGRDRAVGTATFVAR